MNGNVVNQWKGLDGMPNKMLPGGSVMGSTGCRNPKYGYQDILDLVEVDWEGRIVWKFDRYELRQRPAAKTALDGPPAPRLPARGQPRGLLRPRHGGKNGGGKTLILCHKNLTDPAHQRTIRWWTTRLSKWIKKAR